MLTEIKQAIRHAEELQEMMTTEQAIRAESYVRVLKDAQARIQYLGGSTLSIGRIQYNRARGVYVVGDYIITHLSLIGYRLITGYDSTWMVGTAFIDTAGELYIIGGGFPLWVSKTSGVGDKVEARIMGQGLTIDRAEAEGYFKPWNKKLLYEIKGESVHG